MGIQLAPIEGTPYAGGTATGIIYLDANGLQRTSSPGPTVDASGDLTVGGSVTAGGLTSSNLTSGRIPFATTGGRLTDSGGLSATGSRLITTTLSVSGCGAVFDNAGTHLQITAQSITDTPLVVEGAVGQTADIATIGDVTIDSASNLTLGGDLTLPSPTVPASSSATGVAGTVSWDADYIYVCTATDTWKRVAIATW